MSLLFVFNSILLGVGLAMDAFSVSVADAMNEPDMKKAKMCTIAGFFAFFQFLMPLAGWFCVHSILQVFQSLEKWIPWIALALLVYLGAGMIKEGSEGEQDDAQTGRTTLKVLFLQSIATSIDALSVGFTIADYEAGFAFAAALIIAAVTFLICMTGLLLGKKLAERARGRASVFGGIILILIGLEIWIKGIL